MKGGGERVGVGNSDLGGCSVSNLTYYVSIEKTFNGARTIYWSFSCIFRLKAHSVIRALSIVVFNRS